MKDHLWKGRWIADAELAGLLAADLSTSVPPALATADLLAATDRLARDLAPGTALHAELSALASAAGDSEDGPALLAEVAAFLERGALEKKLRRELGSTRPFALERADYGAPVFEAWAPIGILAHVTPTNAPNVPFLSVVEGLLAGNVNLVKLSASDRLYPLALLRALVERGPGLAPFIYAARLSSRRRDEIRRFFSVADGLAAWGSEEAVRGARELAPASARVIEWGPKISLAYVAADRLGDEAVWRRIARSVAELEQQACSSPQVVFAESEGGPDLAACADRLAAALAAEAPARIAPGAAAQGEITRVTRVAKLAGCLPDAGAAGVREGEGWRILIDEHPVLQASPLYRTVWLKPLRRAEIGTALRPFRFFLQTVGLECGLGDLAELTGAFLRAGALRVTPTDSMTAGYEGEPHDGVYALQRYCRRVSVRAGALAGVASFAEIEAPRPRPMSGPIVSKEGFAAREIDPRHAHLHFKSGGSSGEPQLSIFSYDDYHEQMKLAAHGLVAAGFDPARDRAMNLFFSGGLYGGFLSFFTILEELGAVQFPMTAHGDFDFVARTIVRQRADVLLGMPSYLLQLYRAQGEALRGRVRKVFFGGEALNLAQRAELRAYGVEVIRSAAYGGNDTGPMGYQCPASEGGVHHLHEGLHELEILALDRDAPAPPGEAGRMVFSSHARQGQALHRYAVGDLGRWLPGDCACGRRSRRFELLGRHGDVFRAAGMFLNYRKWANLLADRLGYAGEAQVELWPATAVAAETLVLKLAAPADPARARETLLADDPALAEVVLRERALGLRVVLADSFERTPGSGKLRPILDYRSGP